MKQFIWLTSLSLILLSIIVGQHGTINQSGGKTIELLIESTVSHQSSPVSSDKNIPVCICNDFEDSFQPAIRRILNSFSSATSLYSLSSQFSQHFCAKHSPVFMKDMASGCILPQQTTVLRC